MYEDRRASSIISGQRLSSIIASDASSSRRSSGNSTVTPDSQAGIKIVTSSEPKDLRRQALQRHQTFDSTGSENDEQLLAAASSAHTTRSHSCIAPVDVSIRRLSGGINLIEESSFDLAEADRMTPPDSVKKESDQTTEKDVTEIVPDSSVQQQQQSMTAGQTSSVTPMLATRQDTITSRSAGSALSSTRSSFAISRSEQKRREALWDLFQSECVFLYDHLMVLKNVFMEPLKKIQVEGFAMFAEPEVLFGNLDELCCVTYAFCKEFLSVILQQMNQYEVNATDALVRLFLKSSKAASLTQAYHRYTLNYINALNYLETLRRQGEFNEFERVSHVYSIFRIFMNNILSLFDQKTTCTLGYPSRKLESKIPNIRKYVYVHVVVQQGSPV